MENPKVYAVHVACDECRNLVFLLKVSCFYVFRSAIVILPPAISTLVVPRFLCSPFFLWLESFLCVKKVGIVKKCGGDFTATEGATKWFKCDSLSERKNEERHIFDNLFKRICWAFSLRLKKLHKLKSFKIYRANRIRRKLQLFKKKCCLIFNSLTFSYWNF